MMKQEIRKVWSSNYTLLVSLPARWTKKYKVSKFDSVDLIDNEDGTLTVRKNEIE